MDISIKTTKYIDILYNIKSGKYKKKWQILKIGKFITCQNQSNGNTMLPPSPGSKVQQLHLPSFRLD